MVNRRDRYKRTAFGPWRRGERIKYHPLIACYGFGQLVRQLTRKGITVNRTIVDLVESYVLSRELAESSVDYYRRISRVLCTWANRRVPADEFNVDLVNRFLRDKQAAGRSCYYRKSLRNALRALLGFHLGATVRGQIRPVKLEPLQPAAWSAEEVARLIDACSCLKCAERQDYMRTLIAVAYYTGLSQIDLHRIERRDFDLLGVIRTKRSKTGRRVVAAIPPALLSSLDSRPPTGPLWPCLTSRESLRKVFNRIVRKAGLRGTFKTLRNSSGTAVEKLHPGRGHEHLGNTRQIFERHYLDETKDDKGPLQPPEL